MADDTTIVRNPEAIRDILKHVCARNEIAILVTPYVKFELNFLYLDQEVFHVTATMSREEALDSLRHADLKVRFPHGQHIFRASTNLAGTGLALGRKSLRLSIPAALENDDFRRAFRVERVGRVQVTFSSRTYDLLLGSLVNLSTGGARIFSAKDFEEDEILLDDSIHVTIPLTPEITINTTAKVRHVRDRTVGLEFRPALDGRLLDDLGRWAFQKKEEALAHFNDQEEAAQAGFTASPVAAQGPVIALVGGPPDLEELLRAMLSGLPPLKRFPATVQSMRALAADPQAVILFFVEAMDHEHQKRASLLLEAVRGKVPFILLGTKVEAAALMQLANDWEALMGVATGGPGMAGLPRLLAGVLERRGVG